MPTFLFTDLESSTRLWEEHPVAMQDALARHDAILRRAVEEAGGTVVKTTGDGLMAVFSSAVDAVEAALAAQQGIEAGPWDATGALRVRMGIHGGEAEYREGDYYGTAVNRAARIMAASHGGQVLLSGFVAGMMGVLPGGATLRDLGQHRLKDLTQPEHLFQLLHDDLAADFPPPATIDATPNNLPIQVSEFFGRRTELEALQSMLDDPSIRLVTLAGPGGTGKTRLGLQVAAERSQHYRDGVFFVDLSDERASEAAFEAVVRELGLVESSEGHPLQVLKTHLRDRRMLLVLDNFEQVVDAAGGITELLEQCSRLEILVTSRERLRIRGERVFTVPPLALADPSTSPTAIAESEAVRLFVDRARAVLPDFTVTDANARDIAEICLRLDGLPLAIELAAARLSLFSPRDLRERLQDKLAVLGRGGRDVSDRQRTLSGAIAWSYELLDADECRVFGSMSVFAGARLEAIEAITAQALADVDALDVLVSLVDKSLVRSTEVGGSQRFSMLQTIREFAAERLDEDGDVAAAVRRSHAEYYSEYARALADQLRSPRREDALEDLALEIGNLRAAWRHWVDAVDLEKLYLLLDGLWALHDARGWYHSAIELTSDMLDVLSKSAPSPERAAEELTLRTSLARALMAVRGYSVEVEEAFRRALELSDEAGGGARRFSVLRALASYYIGIADIPKAQDIGRELLDLAAREDDESILVEGLFVFGVSVGLTGDVATGLAHLDRATELFDAGRHGSGRFRLGVSPGVSARVASALIRWQSGTLDRARRDATEAVRVARDLDHPFSLAYALFHTGFLAIDGHRFEDAEGCANELAALAAEHKYQIWGALASVLGGVAACGLGRPDEGVTMAEAGVDLYRGLTTPPVFWPPLLGLRAAGFVMAGRPDRAATLLDEAIAVAEAQGVPFPELLVAKGDVIRMLPDGDLAEAAASYGGALDMARMTGFRLTEMKAQVGLAEIRRAGGADADADELRTLYSTFAEGLDTPHLAAARAILEAD